jgi:hypothetical protein
MAGNRLTSGESIQDFVPSIVSRDVGSIHMAQKGQLQEGTSQAPGRSFAREEGPTLLTDVTQEEIDKLTSIFTAREEEISRRRRQPGRSQTILTDDILG